MKGNGWNDIGYNFLVDRYGTVYEGRAGGIDAQRDRRALARLQHRHGRRRADRELLGRDADPAEQAALVRLLAWRLDVAHVDPLSRGRRHLGWERQVQGGQGRHPARDLGPPRHGPDRVPGQPRLRAAARDRAARRADRSAEALLGVASGALGGPIRFQGRLSSAAAVDGHGDDGDGDGRRAGPGSLVDRRLDLGLVAARARGRSGGRSTPGRTFCRPRGRSAVDSVRACARRRALGRRLPAAPAPTPAPSTTSAVVSGLTVTPATLTPTADGTGIAATVSFTLAAPAQVTATVSASTGGSALLDAALGEVPAGPRTYQWDIGTLANGRYKLVVCGQPSSGARRRTDRRRDRRPHARRLRRPRPRRSRRTATASPTRSASRSCSRKPPPSRSRSSAAASTVATVWSAQVVPGLQTIGWDGTSGGVRLPDGDYIAVVTATSPLGTVSLLRARRDRHDAARADAARRVVAALRPERGCDRLDGRERPVDRVHPAARGVHDPVERRAQSRRSPRRRGTRPATPARSSPGPVDGACAHAS